MAHDKKKAEARSSLVTDFVTFSRYTRQPRWGTTQSDMTENIISIDSKRDFSFELTELGLCLLPNNVGPPHGNKQRSAISASHNNH